MTKQEKSAPIMAEALRLITFMQEHLENAENDVTEIVYDPEEALTRARLEAIKTSFARVREYLGEAEEVFEEVYYNKRRFGVKEA